MAGDAYVARKAWRRASLRTCPFHGCRCHLRRHGCYPRVKPAGIRIARFLCPVTGKTVSLLPDFLASHLTGELDEVERAVCQAEGARSVEAAADKVRLEVELPGAVRWLRRRLGPVRAALLVLVTVIPGVVGGKPSLVAMREHLKTERVLVRLRELGRAKLSELPPPVGFGPRLRPSHTKRDQTAAAEGLRVAPAAAEGRPEGET